MMIEVMNLPYYPMSQRAALASNLGRIFQRFGVVSQVEVFHGHPHGSGRPVAFIEMPDAEAGWSAIEGLRGSDFCARDLVVIRVL